MSGGGRIILKVMFWSRKCGVLFEGFVFLLSLVEVLRVYVSCVCNVFFWFLAVCRWAIVLCFFMSVVGT